MSRRLAAAARVVPRVVLFAVALGGVASCTEDGSATVRVDDAGAYIAVIRWAADNALPPDAEGRPVVYITAADGELISSGVQAEVARATVDDIDVRFADRQGEAVDQDDERQPVKDGGVLVIAGELPGDAGVTAVLSADVYRGVDDVDSLVFRLRASSSGVTVSSVSSTPTS